MTQVAHPVEDLPFSCTSRSIATFPAEDVHWRRLLHLFKDSSDNVHTFVHSAGPEELNGLNVPPVVEPCVNDFGASNDVVSLVSSEFALIVDSGSSTYSSTSESGTPLLSDVAGKISG